MKYFFTLVITSICILICILSNAQSNIDVLHYQFHISLSDANDSIYGAAIIRFTVKEKEPDIQFDLANLNKEGKGMLATMVGYKIDYAGIEKFTQKNDKLIIPSRFNKGDTAEVIINYKGIPADGLIISKNKYGHRTFFSDNWPDRAHNWIPCHDDPFDKASVEFIIAAPSHYKVVSNGILVEEKDWLENNKLTHWKEDVPLPTKVMVIGAADFAVDTAGIVNNIPVTSWVFPEDKKQGFYDYAQAKDILFFFMNYIGTYPYKKLANVQSKTIFGGMENANAIFYYENSITGKREEEKLLSHEIVHQWFGDMATEKSFAHLWLSEGFATYLTIVYTEATHGKDKATELLKEDRQQVIDFTKTSDRPVVDTISPVMQLLNANSYQKGGWVLHMLRRQRGDSVFHAIIRNYYAAYKGGNADTRNFQKICEQTSGKNLGSFFQQWLYTPGQPKLKAEWKYNTKTKKLLLTVTQLQKDLFQFPLEISVQSSPGKLLIQNLQITKQSQQFMIPVKGKPVKIELDPHTSLLFEGSVKRLN
jgi:aminopeptidase N